MKSVIWTFENKRPKIYSIERYHYIENRKQLDKLIDKLLDIDAVSSPADLRFPVMLELEDGFAPNLVRADLTKMRHELKNLQKMVDILGRKAEDKTNGNKANKKEKKK